jgi:CubicO group peptidase (beta-lactamase class C family)
MTRAPERRVARNGGWRRLAAILLAWLLAVPVLAQAPTAPPPPRQVDLSPAHLDRWADATFGKAFAQSRLSGVGIVAVQDGRVVYRKTIGYADYRLHTPIDPAVTRFRIGSESKTFTALAIATLLDRHRIRSLYDPANLYLKRLALPRVAGRDITIWDLLNHRGGFRAQEWWLDPVSRPLNRADIASNVPGVDPVARDVSNYCNFCSAVLGLIVEDVSGELLEDYLDRVVLRPLGMANSQLDMGRWPGPNVGKAYDLAPGKPPVLRPYAVIPEFYAPAGSIDATMDDMGRYLVAMLGGSGSQILSAQGRATLFGRHAGNHPAVSGYGMIWMAHRWNGVEVREHGGAIGDYHSMMSLFPDQKAGIFVSCFCQVSKIMPAPGARFAIDGHNFREMIYNEFLGRPALPPLPPGDLAAYAGSYGAEAGLRRWPIGVGMILAPEVTRVTVAADGLTIDGKGPYRRVGDDMFRFADVNGGDVFIPYPNKEVVAFMRDGDGRIDRITGALSMNTARRLSAIATPLAQRTIWIAATLLLACGLWSMAWPRPTPIDRRVHRLLCTTAVLGLVSSVSIPVVLLLGWITPLAWSGERMRLGYALAVAPALTALASIACAIGAIALWWGKEGRGKERRSKDGLGKRALLAGLVSFGGLALIALFVANS